MNDLKNIKISEPFEYYGYTLREVTGENKFIPGDYDQYWEVLYKGVWIKRIWSIMRVRSNNFAEILELAYQETIKEKQTNEI